VPLLAVDLGGTFLRCGVAGDNGDIVALRRSRISNFLDGAAPQAVWESILSEIASYAIDVDSLLGPGEPIIVSFPGPVSGGRFIHAAPTVVGAHASIPDLAALLEARTRRPVRILNDISAAAWYVCGRVAVDRFMVVTVSSGVGSKIFDRRHAAGVMDDLPNAGEIGHCVVDFAADAPECDCGGRGHLGAISSGRGTERLARRKAREEPAAFAASRCCTVYGATPDSLNNEQHFVPAVRSGDEWAVDVMRLAMRPLAGVIAATTYAAGLEHVAIVGGFAVEIGAAYVDCLEGLLQPLSHPSPFAIPASGFVSLADLHPEACLLGAAEYGRRLETAAR
jgi:glucokinase